MIELIRGLLIMSLSGSLVAALLFALKPLIRSRLPKSVQYYLWLVVIAALLVPVSAFIKLPAVKEAPVIPIPSNIVSNYVLPDGEVEYINAPQDTQPTEIFIAGDVSVLLLVYPAGALAVLLFYTIHYSIFTRLHRRRNIHAQPEELEILSALCGNKRMPKLYRNPLTAMPMLIGLIRPAILLPDRAYSDAQLRAVLLHEITHLRRKDILIKWLAVLACTVHWFNPVAWLMRREIDRACELSCDEAAIRSLDADGRQNYGETLLYVAAEGTTPRAVLSTTMCEEKKALKERLGAIMKSKKCTRFAAILSLILILAVSGTALALGAGRKETRNAATQTMTLDDVREIAQKGTDLMMADLNGFIGEVGGSGLYIVQYEIAGSDCVLMVGSGNTTDVWYAYLLPHAGAEIEEAIDIRYYDVDKFLADGTKELIRPMVSPVLYGFDRNADGNAFYSDSINVYGEPQ